MDVEPIGAEFEEGWPAATARLCHRMPGRPEHDHRIHSGIPAARNTEACHPGSNGARCRPLDWKAGGVLVVLAHEDQRNLQRAAPRRCAHHYRTVRVNMRTDQIIASTATMTRLSHTDAAPMRPAYNARIPLVTQ